MVKLDYSSRPGALGVSKPQPKHVNGTTQATTGLQLKPKAKTSFPKSKKEEEEEEVAAAAMVNM